MIGRDRSQPRLNELQAARPDGFLAGDQEWFAVQNLGANHRQDLISAAC